MTGRRVRRPSITKVGTVEHGEDGVLIHGWTLGFCASGCDCHRHPKNGQLYLRNGLDGSLGLICFRIDGCSCCAPWQPDELAAIVRDLTDIAALTEA
jgi:hypothetical protein